MTSANSETARRRLLLGGGLFLTTFFVGCSQDSAAMALPELTVEAPSEFQDHDKTWVSSDIRAADRDCLARFFQRNQKLVGSPDMVGNPLLYTSGKSDRRFYWLTASIDGRRWTCVHFEKGRFASSEGAGSPF